MRVDQLEKRVYESVIQMNDFNRFQKLLSFCGNGNIYQMSVENIFAVYNQRPDATLITGLMVGKNLEGIHCKTRELLSFRMIFRERLQNFQNLFLILQTLREEKFIYGA